MSKSDPHIDKELRDILENLANGIFPLADWIESKNKRGIPAPKEPPKLPWRHGAKITPNDLGAIDFFEALLREPQEEEKLLHRWEELEHDPLKHFPLDGKQAWRAARGLDPKTQFGVLESENTLVDIDDHPVIRAVFYAAFWPLLREAVRRRKPKGSDWISFAAELHGDNCAQWPVGQPLKSSTLIYQFGRDLLQAMMNMRNDAADDPWKHALLIELGEHRRVGNEWTRIQADDAVREFKQAWDDERREKAPEPPAPAGPAPDMPVGTPPQRPYKGRRSPLVQEVS